MRELVLIILVLGYTEQVGYYCGDVKIDINADCLCGNQTFRYQDSDTGCCGRVHCDIVDGRGICDGGKVCIRAKHLIYHYPCGDIMHNNDCQCGSHNLTDLDYWHGLWCCKGISACEYNEGGVYCTEGEIVTGFNNSCNNQCGHRNYLSCDSGDQCVDREDICHGYPVCRDSSDIQKCHEEEITCDHNFQYSKCKATPSGHQ